MPIFKNADVVTKANKTAIANIWQSLLMTMETVDLGIQSPFPRYSMLSLLPFPAILYILGIKKVGVYCCWK